MMSPNGFPISSRRCTTRNDYIQPWGIYPRKNMRWQFNKPKPPIAPPSNLGEISPVGGAQSKSDTADEQIDTVHVRPRFFGREAKPRFTRKTSTEVNFNRRNCYASSTTLTRSLSILIKCDHRFATVNLSVFILLGMLPPRASDQQRAIVFEAPLGEHFRRRAR